MLATLSRFQGPLRRPSGRPLGLWCFLAKKKLTWTACCLLQAARRLQVLGRYVSTVAPLQAKIRAQQKKRNFSEKKLSRYFVDHRCVRLVAGSGGKGACSFHSEPRKEWGGPDGGNGGDGGSISFKADRLVKSLAQLVPVYMAEDGESGGNKNCYGRNGRPTFICVPVGTVVKEDGRTVVDLSEHGQVYLAVFGGSGGKGNRFFLSNENRAPMTSTSGTEGQERVLHLELRTMAHAGLVGFPNAGKSSLLRAISNAKPAVAAYPFTTLNPHVGIVKYRDHEQVAVRSGSFVHLELDCCNQFVVRLGILSEALTPLRGPCVSLERQSPLLSLISEWCISMADIPGIIQGAHLNRGLGISFLRHIERCRFLLFVLDASSPEPWNQLQHLRYELDQYEPGLSQRPHAIVANKIDLHEARENLETLKSRVTQRVIPVSALTGHNTEELILHLRELYDGHLHGDGSTEGGKPTRW